MSESDGAELSCRLAGVSLAAPASPLEDDDLLREILLRLPPQPSSLPRASAVCKGWSGLVTDPKFARSFSAHHWKPPLLGFFEIRNHLLVFTQVMDPPDRIPPERFDLGPCNANQEDHVFSCRHGRVVVIDFERLEFLVCTPITGERSRVALLPEVNPNFIRVAVLCAAADQGHVHGACHSNPFKLVSLCMGREDNQVLARVYSSQTGAWGNLISAPAPFRLDYDGTPETLVGNALYWLCPIVDVVKFDLDDHSLTVFKGPPDRCGRRVVQAEDGDIGFNMFTYPRCEMWRRNADYHGVADTWVLWKTVEMHTILALPPPQADEERLNFVIGYCEDTEAFFIYVKPSVYMVQLKAMQSKRLDDLDCVNIYRPFTSFYTPGDFSFFVLLYCAQVLLVDLPELQFRTTHSRTLFDVVKEWLLQFSLSLAGNDVAWKTYRALV
ncbi:hypothetical protein QYE76_049425 [Lolium multiflorum]|uniref:F-box domain-containing protein n=1 Tax=Lolium multiflorum TaxID=4521 RepID=A0AAD8SPX8_LOLMU|nr:hypothetical protein QYE76_049425 [Lolium multiflorum]